MSHLNAYGFSFDGVNSNAKNLFIGKLNGDAVVETNPLGVYESYTDKTNKSDEFISLGGSYTEPLKQSFYIMLEQDYNYTRDELADIHQFYFNRDRYLPLQIWQDDLSDYIYYCKLLNPVLTYINTIGRAWVCEMECNSPYAYKKEDTEYTITNTSPQIITNKSMCENEIYPSIEIKSTTNSNTIRITNNTNNSYFQISGLANGEIINVNRIHKIKTSLGENIRKLKDTDKTFLSLIYGRNNITVTGSFEYVKISFSEAMKVGV